MGQIVSARRRQVRELSMWCGKGEPVPQTSLLPPLHEGYNRVYTYTNYLLSILAQLIASDLTSRRICN